MAGTPGSRAARKPPSAPAAPRASAAAPAPPLVWLAGLAALAVAIAMVVQRRAIGAYFTPDDFVQLEQARGLLPWPVTAWRWLSGFAWVRLTTSAFGADPVPYHVANLLLHGANVALLFALARRLGASLLASFLAAVVFGAWRTHGTALASAASAGEMLALGLLLSALLANGRGAARAVLSVVLLAAALFAKESVLLVPLALALRPEAAAKRATPAPWAPAVVALVVGGVLLVAGRGSGRLGGEAYAIGFGGNLFHAAGLLMAWNVDLTSAIPDGIGAAESGVWAAGLAAFAGLAAVAFALRRRAPLVAVGVAWWALAVAPVLPLVHQAHLHYLVTPTAGLALAVAGLADAWRPAPSSGRRSATAPAVLGAIALAWAAWNDHLLAARVAARLPGTDTPADPVTRKAEYARRLVEDTRAALGTRRANVAFMLLEGTQIQLDLATGDRSALDPTESVRNTVEATLGERGLVLRAALPNVDSVAYVHRLESSLAGFECFVPGSENRLQALGQPPAAFEVYASGLVNAGLALPAARMLERAGADWPDRPWLLYVRAMALGRLGERERALADLRRVVVVAPADSFAARARAILESEGAAGGLPPPAAGPDARR